MPQEILPLGEVNAAMLEPYSFETYSGPARGAADGGGGGGGEVGGVVVAGCAVVGMAVGAGAPVVEGCSVVGVAAVGVAVDVVPSEAWGDAGSWPHPARPTQPTIRAKRICRPADAEFMAVNHRVRLVVRPELSPGVPGFRSGTHAIVALRPVGR